MDYLKTADEIVDVYFVTYIESCDKNNNSHSTSWRNRYIGQDGVIYILKNGNRQFFVWHPVDDDFKPDIASTEYGVSPAAITSSPGTNMLTIAAFSGSDSD